MKFIICLPQGSLLIAYFRSITLTNYGDLCCGPHAFSPWFKGEETNLFVIL